MNAELLLTTAILGVIALHAAWRARRRERARRLLWTLRQSALPSGRPLLWRIRRNPRAIAAGRLATSFSALALVLIAAALTVLLTTARPVLTIQSAADPGTAIVVRGAGFADDLAGVLALDGSAAGMPGFAIQDDGTFTAVFHLPDTLAPGTHLISALAPDEVAVVAFTVDHGVAALPSAQDLQSFAETVPEPSWPVQGLTTSPEFTTPPESTTPLESTTPPPASQPPDATASATATAALSPSAGPASTPTPAPTPTPSPPRTATPRPTPTPPPASGAITHVIVVWMENKETTSITATSMPYLYGLSQTYGRATGYTGVSHPSLPNYLAFWSGSTQGVTDDGTYNFGGASLSSQMASAGRSWRTYVQDYPSTAGCHTASTYSGGIDGWGVAGTYARKHNPAMSFTSVSGTTACNNIQPLASFDPSVNVAFVVPNLCNDMHDCSLATGDAFLKAFLPHVFNAPDWAHTLLFVSFDEGSSGTGGGGRVFTVVARAGLSGFVSSTAHNHYGMLRTIEDIFGLPCLHSSCSATPLSEFLP